MKKILTATLMIATISLFSISCSDEQVSPLNTVDNDMPVDDDDPSNTAINDNDNTLTM